MAVVGGPESIAPSASWTAISPDIATAPTGLLISESARLRSIRRIAYASVFAFLVCLEAYGFWSHPQLLATVWTPSGHTRFLSFAGVYLLGVVLVLYFAPQRLPLILAVAMALVACAAVGVGAPAAVGLFLLSAFVLGRALLWRHAEADYLSFEDMILATLFGAVIYMTAIGWTAMLPVHFAAVHMIVLALPLVIWPATLAKSLRSLAALVRPVAWRSRWHYLGFALAAFIPLAHLIGAVVLPQANNDAVVLHLAVPSIVAFKHYWPFDVDRYVFAVFPMGTSWMILAPYLLGGEFAARLVNWCFFLATAFLLFSVVRRYLAINAAWMLVALYASTPFFLTENGNIFTENLWVALLFGATFAIWRFKETGQERYFVLAASLAAASLGVKLLGAVLVATLVVLVLRDCLARPVRLAWAIGIFAVMAAYPYAYAFIKTGNPVFPLLNHIFKSPFFAEAAFGGLNRSLPTSLYQLTFQTLRWMDGGGTSGALGFHYLVLIPLSLLALGRTYPYVGWVSLICAVVSLSSVSLLAEPNVRYFYPALPFITILAAIVYAQARELSRILYLSLCCYGVAAMLVNAYAMPLSAWAHREFSFAMAFGRLGLDEYLSWVAPERKLIAYLNLTRGHAVRVANFARPMIIDFKGDSVLGNWYNHPFSTKRLSRATSAEEVHRLMREERITMFMAFGPGGEIPNGSRAVEAFLANYTEPEFIVGNVYVARYKEAWRFSEELVKNGDFAAGLTNWGHAPITVHDAAARTVSVTSTNGIVQRVPVDERVMYRYAITARCANPGTHVRLWINWYDAQQRHFHTTVVARACENAVRTFAEEVAPPEGARAGELVVAGHEPDRSVEVSNVSLRW
jgi:hypothetical protein